MLVEYQITTSGQCHCLESVPKGADILFIDGKEFIARCENCGRPIVEDDDFHNDGEGVYICKPCANELFKAEQEKAPTLGMEEDK